MLINPKVQAQMTFPKIALLIFLLVTIAIISNLRRFFTQVHKGILKKEKKDKLLPYCIVFVFLNRIGT